MAHALVAHYDGQLADAVRRFEAALDGARADDDPWWRDRCLLHLAMIAFETHDDRLVSLSERRFDPLIEARPGGGEAALCRALRALDSEGIEDVDAALDRLRVVDSQWMIAYVQDQAAEVVLDAGDAEDAVARATAALSAAGRVGRVSETAIAHVLAARARETLGDVREAQRHREAAREVASMAEALSARARDYVDTA
jgi:hypothetical protein